MVVHLCVCEGIVHIHTHENQKTALGATLRNTIYFLWDKVPHWPGAYYVSWTSCQARSRNPPVLNHPRLGLQGMPPWPAFYGVFGSKYGLCASNINTLLTESSLQPEKQNECTRVSKSCPCFLAYSEWSDRLPCSKLGYRKTIASVLGVVTVIIDWQFNRM